MVETKLNPAEETIQKIALGRRFNHSGFSSLIRDLYSELPQSILASYVRPDKESGNNIRFTLTQIGGSIGLLTSLYDKDGRIESIIEEFHGQEWDVGTSFELHKFDYDERGRVTNISTSCILPLPDYEGPRNIDTTLKGAYNSDGSINESLVRLVCRQEFVYDKNALKIKQIKENTGIGQNYHHLFDQEFTFDENKINLDSQNKTITIILNEKGEIDYCNLSKDSKELLSGRFSYDGGKSLVVNYQSEIKKIIKWVKDDFKTEEFYLGSKSPAVWKRDKNGNALSHDVGDRRFISLGGVLNEYSPLFMKGRLPDGFLVDFGHKSHQYGLMGLIGINERVTLWRRENDYSHLKPYQNRIGI